MSVYNDIIDEINSKYHTEYKLDGAIGEGSFVKVFNVLGYKSSQNDTHEYVGRFTLKPTVEESWEWISKKTEQEYKLLTRKDLDELYVGKLEKTYKDPDGEWFFSIQKKFTPLSEYLSRTLGKHASPKKKEYIFSKVFHELAEAMVYVHNIDYEKSKGILLRDVKPENIMYNSDTGRCILCDFNTAREFDTQDYWASSTITAGTLMYMAPEIHVVEGGTETRPNPRQDVYSLGATLFSLITHKSTKTPLPSGSQYRVREIQDDIKIKHLEKSGLSSEFQAIIYCSIQKDPGKRYQTAEELELYTSLLYDVRSLENKEDSYQKNISELTSKVSSLQNNNESIQKRLDNAIADKEKAVKDTSEKIKASQKKVEELTKENRKLRMQDEKNTEALQEKASLLEEVEDLRSKNDRLEDVLDNLRLENIALENEKKKIEEENKKLKSSTRGRESRTESEKDIDEFLWAFETPVEEIEADIRDYLNKKPSDPKPSDKKKPPANTKKKSPPKKITKKKTEENLISKFKKGDKKVIGKIGVIVNCVWGVLLFFALYFNILDKTPNKNLVFTDTHILVCATFLLLPYFYFEFTRWLYSEPSFINIFICMLIYSTACGVTVSQWNTITNSMLMSRGAFILLILLFAYQTLSFEHIDNAGLAAAAVWTSMIIFLLVAFIAIGIIPTNNGFYIGKTIQLGQYEQDNDQATTEEPINWKIKNIMGNNALIVSENYLDYMSYNDSNEENSSWENSSLRSWLNTSFLGENFSPKELSCIYVIPQKTKKESYKLLGKEKESTKDAVFFIKSSQIFRFFFLEKVEPSKYALAKYEADDSEYKEMEAWTRTPVKDSQMVVTAGKKSIGYFRAYSTQNNEAFVYPVMCIDLKEYKKIQERN